VPNRSSADLDIITARIEWRIKGAPAILPLWHAARSRKQF
jgi:hypothetical protein